VAAFDNLVQGVITNNPFQCTTYNQGGSDHPPVERSKQGYTVRIVYQDGTAKTVAVITVRAPTIAAFTAAANQIVANNAAGDSHLGGTPVPGLRRARSSRRPCGATMRTARSTS
jgi:hypothetical protein